MCVAIDKKTLLAGYLNLKMTKEPTNDEIEFTIDDLLHYTKQLWNAGCGPIIADFTRAEMGKYLNSMDICNNIIDERFRISMGNFKVDDEAFSIFMSKISARRVSLFLELNAQINYPYLLLSFMGFDCFFDTPSMKIRAS